MAAGMNTSSVHVCKYLLPQNKERTVYDGFIESLGQEFHLRVELPVNKDLKFSRIHCDAKLATILRGSLPIIRTRLQQCQQLSAFLEELRSLVDSAVRTNKMFESLSTAPALYGKLINEISIVKWDRVVDIDECFQKVKLQTIDSSAREHYISVHISSQYPNEAPECSTDLPSEFSLQWNSKMSLVDVLQQFDKAVERHQTFWNVLDEIDKSTWVLEPEKPCRKDAARRIALGNNASIQIVVNPLHPTQLPECRFLGADQTIKPLRDNMNRSLQMWDSSKSVLSNLQELMNITFPSPISSKKEDFCSECSICYLYRLDGAIPDKVCKFPACNKAFHQICLYEWLRSLPTSNQSLSKYGFKNIYGECPYCSQPITVRQEDK
ncbi:E3 ubiquitin-protein ligase FANCL-like [Anneissia japonica]|uniref:E3 ubiquitin-protein ligase FANCL-like n=1 Tax=Anneissia japonica TaxID=1529436 RepID=UPI001425A3AC|nr:E3 ubiquitin-protein ligase FANCL-like [Anneissia japonica]